MRTYLCLALSVCLTVLLLLPARTLLAAPRGAFDAYNFPYDRFAGQLRQAGFGKGLIIAENGLVGGNLRLHLPESTVVAVDLPRPDLVPTESCLIAWEANDQPEPPRSLIELAGNLQVTIDPGRQDLLEAPYHFSGDPPQNARFGIMPCQP